MRSETDGCAAMSFCLFGRARKSCSRTEEAKGKSRYFDLNFLPFFCPKIFVPSCHYSNYIISSYSYNFLIKTKNISIDRQICFSSYFCWRVDFFLLIPADRTKQNKIFERKLKINERKNKKFIILSKGNRKTKNWLPHKQTMKSHTIASFKFVRLDWKDYCYHILPSYKTTSTMKLTILLLPTITKLTKSLARKRRVRKSM